MSLNILIVPGYHGSGDAHWQTWLQQQIPGARRVTGIEWDQPVLHNWGKAIINELEANSQQTVIVAHSFGCLATALAIANRPRYVAGVIMVAPADPDRFTLFGARTGVFASHPSIASQLPDQALGTPGLVIGSRNDPWMKLQHAYAWSKRWQLGFHDAGHVGHINVESGFGPWGLIKLFTESLCELLNNKATESAQASDYRKRNRRLPTPAVIFNQQHLLYA